MTTKVHVPFPCAENPHLDAVREDNIAWMLSHGLFDSDTSLDRYRESNFPELYCYVYPHAAREEIKLLVDFETFMFLYDDQFAGHQGESLDRPMEAMGEFMAIMYSTPGGRPSSRSRLGSAFVDVLARMLDGMSPSWQRQFFWSCQRFYASYLHEAENRLRKDEPLRLALYLKQRQWALGVEPSIDAIERGGRFEIPPHMRSDPRLLGLREEVNYFIALANDIDSLAKEEFTGDINNSVLLLEHNEGMPRKRAIEEVSHQAQDAIRRFEQRSAVLLASHPYTSLSVTDQTNVVRYVTGLRHWIAGYYRWTKQTGRYAPASAEREAMPWSPHELLRVTPTRRINGNHVS
ncbi:hypothetical protein ACIQU6_33760 [Streptomyces sp. NPDC090442]|uniref:terpene synthase family protein n=1 Tax=Streptomyces sp. NPDC090442 TaxID=3365962 RepID=UPI003816216C